MLLVTSSRVSGAIASTLPLPFLPLLQLTLCSQKINLKSYLCKMQLSVVFHTVMAVLYCTACNLSAEDVKGPLPQVLSYLSLI